MDKNRSPADKMIDFCIQIYLFICNEYEKATSYVKKSIR